MVTMGSSAGRFNINGAILAGGHARRMGGIPKGSLRLDGALSLVERLIMRATCSGVRETVIVANDPRPYAHLRHEIICDRRTDAGPVAGIEAALDHFDGRCDAVLVLPCDLPAMSSKEMSSLLRAYVSSNAPVVFAETVDGRTHPLCAVVSTGLVAEVSPAIDRGVARVDDLWSHLGASRVVYDNVDAFTNLNSPVDVDLWLAKQKSLAPHSKSRALDPQRQPAPREGSLSPCRSIR